VEFLILYQLFLLQSLFVNFTWNQIVKMFEISSFEENVNIQNVEMMQLKLLQDMQQLLSQISPDNLTTIQKEILEISMNSPGNEHQQLIELVNLNNEHSYLYRPLGLILNLETTELLKFHELFPMLEPLQLMILVRLIQVGISYCFDLYNLFLSDMNKNMENPGLVDVNIAENNESEETPLKLEILEQPPDKCVYKRNVKPNPSVSLVGDSTLIDGNLYIVPTLVRCDTFASEPKHLAGNEPIKVGACKTFAFKKLKILVTSRQMNESHFGLRFELRRYSPDMSEFKVLHHVTSNPICVFSHSTQLKPSPKTKPSLKELIPAKAPSNKKTRIAILGNNFVDSPTTRVKFDDIEVVPVFHGPKTLLCFTPENLSGKVRIQICNDPNSWSNVGSFHFDPSINLQ